MINYSCLTLAVRKFFPKQQNVQLPGILECYNDFYPKAVANLFIAHSVSELYCLCHFYPQWISLHGQSAFATIGFEDNKAVFQELLQTFPNAKIYTAFGNDLSGRVWDAKLSLWQINQDAIFQIAGQRLQVSFDSTEFIFQVESFSLNRFFKSLGKFQTNPALKPRGGYRDFTSKFQALYPIADKR